MPARIAARLRARPARPAGDAGETVRAASSSRWPASTASCSSGLERVTGARVDVVHVIGGGAQQRAAVPADRRRARPPVLAGPVEATALGNVLVQARAAGELGSLAELRAAAAASADPIAYEPADAARGRHLRALPLRDVRDASRSKERPMTDTRAYDHSPSSRRGSTSTRRARLASLDRDARPGATATPARASACSRSPAARATSSSSVDDAAEVHRLTGTAGAVALHFPWDAVDDYAALRGHVEERGLRVGAVNPNLFQDPDYRLGSITNPDAARARQGGRAPARVRADRHRARLDRAVAVVRRRHQLPRPGRPARAPRAAARRARRALRRAARRSRSCWSSTSSSSPAFYATDLADWGSALLACQRLGERARVLVDLGHHAQGTNVEQIVALLHDEGRLGGFHFNNRKYADDDLIVGSVNPFELFLIFCELAPAATSCRG